MGGLLRKKEFILFAFGLIGKFLDRTSSSASGKNGIDLLLCGLDCHRFVHYVMRDHVVIIVNSKLISMHIKYYVWVVIVIVVIVFVFVARTVCVGIIIIIVIIIIGVIN